jgi:hypothetical protein
MYMTRGSPNNSSNANDKPFPRWQGLTVNEYQGTVDDISTRIPTFATRPFRFVEGQTCSVNDRLNLVVGETVKPDEAPAPLGVVSKNYRLVQHSTVLSIALDALSEVGIPLEHVRASLRITERGERMALIFLFPEDDPYTLILSPRGDQLRLRLQCFNSVDGSMRFIAMLGWYRFVCSNGLVAGEVRVHFRKRHDLYLDPFRIYEVLSTGLSNLMEERTLHTRWPQTRIDNTLLRRWVDGPLKAKWGVKLAARAYCIARTGRDCRIPLHFEKGPPSEKTMEPTRAVPGSWVPADNAFAVSQVLSWLAKERHEIPEQVERMREIPELIGRLLGTEDRR